METVPLTTGEIAQHCHVTHRAVLKWIASNKLKAYRTPGKHSRVEIADFLDFLTRYNMPIPPEFSSNGNKKKILMVDDDKGMIHAMKRLLMVDNKFALEGAYDGFDAGRKFSYFNPDLMILDIKMPGLDGYQVCSYIRHELKNKDVKILAISGVVEDEGKEKIMALGVDGYLQKPFDSQALKDTIYRLLNVKKGNRHEY